MEYTLVPSESLVSASSLPPATGTRLFWRLSGLFLILLAEALLISSQAQHMAFRGAGGFAGLLFDLGEWKVRSLITMAVVSLMFWQARGRQNLQRVLTSPLGR